LAGVGISDWSGAPVVVVALACADVVDDCDVLEDDGVASDEEVRPIVDSPD
jgi:hypothetical protein